ncbi:O-antigen/teichoic acid export membrane protein [Arthrobacter psychrochitiniphilus]|uniref:Uncharacterized protein n=2 Tax=Arthrobacter psychrochitiniphilus TaxID=291045 RepID=A0A2V3DVZ7_9MICC|nr:O-antigen/teichoic acid export membrane protein [Arthrobacter psychrochitiniphilus]PXA69293.1 hypothetical protein CVS29_01615 [Arthrobacter psychrochitiniphilus]
MTGQVARIAIQALYFILLARLLGVSGYGTFAAIVAAGAIAAPFSSIGTNILMVRNIAQGKSSAKSEWLRALLYSTLLGTLLAAATAYIVSNFKAFDTSIAVIFGLIVADSVGLKIIEMSGSFWQALGKSSQLVWLPPVINFLRLIATAFLMFNQINVDIAVWSVVYSLVTLPLALVIALITTQLSPGPANYNKFWKISRSEIRQGLQFCFGVSAATAYNDIDKTQLASMISTSSAGIYASAYKIIDMAYVPIRSIAIAFYPKFFKTGKEGIAASNRLARKILLPCLCLGALGFTIVQFAAPLVTILLGDDFKRSESIMRGLAFVLLIRPLSFTAGDSLTGSGNQGFRTSIQITLTLANFMGNLILIPQLGIEGAIITTIVCELVLAITMWTYALRLEKKASRRKTHEAIHTLQ